MRIRQKPNGCIVEHGSVGKVKKQSYQQIWQRSGYLATGLFSHNLNGRTVVLLTRSVFDFTASYWACLRLGVTVAPLMSIAEDALRSSDPQILISLLDKIERVLIVTDDYFLPLLERSELARYDSIKLSELSSNIENIPPMRQHPDDLAILIPTSGTTSIPKLVGLSQYALLHRQYSIQKASKAGDYSAMHWFALDGVSGLRISSAQNRELIYLEPRILLSNPLTLLDLVEIYQLAYIPLTCHLAEKIMQLAYSSDRCWQLDSLRRVGFGAEPIAVSTISAFHRFLSAMGFCGEIHVAYGLSETGIVTSNHFTPESDEQTANRDLIDLGSPMPGVAIRIVDDQDQTLTENCPGNIQVRTPNKQFSGYLGDQVLTQEVITTDNWIRTGDIGHITNGNLFVSGRAKDVIIINGKNISLSMIDQWLATGELVSAHQLACCAEMQEGKEQLVIFFVPTDRQPTQVSIAMQAIRRRLLQTTGVISSQIIPLWPDQIPRTSSGKIRRDRLLSLYQEGQLKCCPVPQSEVANKTANGSHSDGPNRIILHWQQVLGQIDAASPEDDFFLSGGSSLASAELITSLEQECGYNIDVMAWLKQPTLGNLIHLATSGNQQTSDPKEHNSWPLSNELLRKQLMHVGAWSGDRKKSDSLVSVHNKSGKKPPLAWVFQGDTEFSNLAKALGRDQPLFGMRSGHGIMTYDENNIQAMALACVRELENLIPHGPIFIGGNCQGAVIALAMAQHWLRRRRRIPLLILMEWPTRLQAYHEPVLLLFGDNSHVNPNMHYKKPELVWNRAFSDYRVDYFRGKHGMFFTKSANLKSLATRLQHHLGAQKNSLARMLPNSAYQLNLSVKTPENWQPGASMYVQVRVVNQSDIIWPDYKYSGLVIASRWESKHGGVLVRRDEDAYIPSLAPKQEVELQLWLTRPQKKQPVQLIVDIVEEGNCWFGALEGNQSVRLIVE